MNYIDLQNKLKKGDKIKFIEGYSNRLEGTFIKFMECKGTQDICEKCNGQIHYRSKSSELSRCWTMVNGNSVVEIIDGGFITSDDLSI